MLLAWKRRPECGAQWFTKEAGGFRAIGPSALWARLWSRLRQPACRLWERPLGDVFSWGHGQTTARDRGQPTCGVHNMASARARARGQASGAAFHDLKIYYEQVSHQE